MARKNKYDKRIEKSIMKILDSLTKKHGLSEVRHASNKWCAAQQAKARLHKAQKALEAELTEVNRKLAS